MNENKIDPKVHAGAASAGAGGSFAAVLLVWALQAMGVPEAQFTPDRVIAITGACAWLGGYIGGYLKKN